MAKPKIPVAVKSNSLEFSNRVLQSVIETVNNLIKDKVAFSSTNGYRLLTLATSCENAFKPAARLLDEYAKDAQEKMNEIVKPFDGDNDKFEKSVDAQNAIRELNNEYVNKVNELLDITVGVDFAPITIDIFRNNKGEDIDLPLGVIHTFTPFFKS